MFFFSGATLFESVELAVFFVQKSGDDIYCEGCEVDLPPSC